MEADILALLHLFRDHVPDRETNSWALELAKNPHKWPGAHDLFDRVRRRNLKAIDRKDHVAECQYCFEEVCLKSLYNETSPRDPFDSDSPHWIIKNAIALARAVGIPMQDVLAVVAPGGQPGAAADPTRE
jgi:hypothetical protein